MHPGKEAARTPEQARAGVPVEREGVFLAKEAQAVKILKVKRIGPDLMIEGSLIDRE